MKSRHLILSVAAVLLTGLSAAAQRVEMLHKQPPRVPEYVVFAGDTIRFDRDDMYERMDRELMAFTYMHSTSYQMLKRSGRYFTQVVPILLKNGVPEDLKYLMVIESNLNPKAVSSAGAAGLWQMMKGTAPGYGMEVGAEVDERFHIEKETEGACKYLREAYSKFGDWMTVAASYNAGQGGISRRISDQGRSSSFDLYLPEETSRYMFRILAAKLFFENPESFGFRIREEDKYPYREPRKIVTVTGPVPSLIDFAAEHGVSYYALKEANLWLRSDKLTNPKGKTYRIAIPGDNRR